MARWVLLITEPSVSLAELIERLRRRWYVEQERAGPLGPEYVICNANGAEAGAVWLNQNNAIADDYEPGELDGLGVDEPNIYFLGFNRISIVKAVLLDLLDDHRIWIDTTYGDYPITRGPEFAARLRANPAWTMDVSTSTSD